MKDEYIIINRTAIQKRIEELENEYFLLSDKSDRSLSDIEEEREIVGEQKALVRILSQSNPLIPVLEDAFNKGGAYTLGSYKDFTQTHSNKQEYVSNLKLDI